MALDELCDRALLIEAAREEHLEVSAAELQQELFRLQVMIGSLAAAAPSSPRMMWAAPAVPSLGAPGPTPAQARAPAPGSPLDRAAEVLAQNGIAARDLAVEAGAELLASKTAQKRVYDAIEVPRREILAALPASAWHDAAAQARVRRALQRRRGAARLAALLAELRTRFTVERVN
jgi:hypothetical protein